MVKNIILICVLVLLLQSCSHKMQQSNGKLTSGNPVFPGWYADPEGVIFRKQFWIYPTFSAPYNDQVFFDAFSSTDLVNWSKHARILDTANVKWAKRAVWAPAIVEKRKQILFIFWSKRYSK